MSDFTDRLAELRSQFACTSLDLVDAQARIDRAYQELNAAKAEEAEARAAVTKARRELKALLDKTEPTE